MQLWRKEHRWELALLSVWITILVSGRVAIACYQSLMPGETGQRV